MPDQEEFGHPNANKKNAEERSNALAYSLKSARVKLKRSNSIAYSSKSARLENWVFAEAFEHPMEEQILRLNARK